MNTLLISALFTTLIANTQDEPCQCKPLPTFSLKASDGLTYTQSSLSKKPTVVFLLSSGCPHNPKAAPDLNKFKALAGSKVGVVAITNMDDKDVKGYAKELGLKIPLLADPNGEIIRKFGGKHSLDIALICSDDKKIGNFWEGYSRSIFGEIFKEISEHGGPKIEADLSVFPTKRASGCSF